MNRTEYKAKLDQIFSDSTKFNILTKNPIKELKTRVNKLIKTANSNSEPRIFQPIVDEFKPGYIYGTVKTHKTGFPLRPIISQIPTPIYSTAKILNKLIIPYLPAKYQINSTDQFLDIIRATDSHGTLASLDVESLFTNVPLETTIEIICDAVYKHDKISPLPFAQKVYNRVSVSIFGWKIVYAV